MANFDPDRLCSDCKHHLVLTCDYPCNNCVDEHDKPIYHPMFESANREPEPTANEEYKRLTTFPFTPGISKGGKQK